MSLTLEDQQIFFETQSYQDLMNTPEQGLIEKSKINNVNPSLKEIQEIIQ